MRRLVIVSNRVPALRERGPIAGGLAVALKDAIASRETLWFGWSGSQADGKTEAPAQVATHGKLTMATIDLTAAQYQGFYRGFSNGMLWPLLHHRVGLSDFKRDELNAYLAVNERFAKALAPLLRPDDLVWVHDYHLIPLGEALRAHGVANRIGFFLHVPFPPPALFETLPGWDKLLRTLDGYDLIGLQTQDDANHLDQNMAAAGIEPRARAFPIGIDPAAFARDARRAAKTREAARMAEGLGERALILGVDRLDYSKGLPQRLRGYAQLLKRFPAHHDAITFLQVTPVSRGDVSQYRALRRELDELAGRINGEHGEIGWVPLHYLTRAVSRTTLAGLHRRARVGLVTPLRDGMNLVAKEFVAAQDPEDPGALVLSRFAGAAAELDAAILVNPYDPDEIAEGLDQALRLKLPERRERWARMDEAVRETTASSWARSFLTALEDEQSG